MEEAVKVGGVLTCGTLYCTLCLVKPDLIRYECPQHDRRNCAPSDGNTHPPGYPGNVSQEGVN